ncbi:MAG TPA: MFS transporter [Mycobacteriales bacterium]|nr:MFS transporter [Mycobacteriales bacterium]
MNSPRAGWLVVGTVCLGALLGQLDASIVTLALPAIRTDLGGSVGAVEWVSLSYLLSLVALLVPVGRAADVLGRKALYQVGFGLFTAASIGCAVAPSLLLLDLARVVQGAGAALLQANSTALVVQAAPPGRLGQAIGLQGAAQALGLALGPTVGGALLAVGSWRLLFLVGVPFGLLGLVAGILLLPRTRDLELPDQRRYDTLGLLAVVAATGLVLLGLSFAAQPHPPLPVAIGALAASALAATAAIVRQHSAGRRGRLPALDSMLLASVPFRRGLGGALVGYAATFGVLFAVPFYLVQQAHMAPLRAGLLLGALPIALGLAAPFGGRWADRIGTARVSAAGLTLSAVGFVALVVEDPRPLALVAALSVIGLGLGLFTPANNAAVMAAAPVARAGAAAGLLNMTRALGTALGVAIAALAYDLAGTHGGPSAGLRSVSALFAACLLVAAGWNLRRR